MLFDERGSSAIEFALVAPVLVILCLGLIDGWSLTSFVLSMRASVGSAANMYLQGVGNDATVKSVAFENWQGRPSDASLVLNRIYKCGETTVSDGALCGTKPPAVYVKIYAQGTWIAPFEVDFLGTHQLLSHDQVVRVR